MPERRRITLDLDEAGNPVGASVTWFENGDEVEVAAWSPPPFHSVEDALLVAIAEERRQGQLWERDADFVAWRDEVLNSFQKPTPDWSRAKRPGR